MKTIFGVIALLSGIFAHAGTCDLVSGSFKTTTSECQYSHDGVTFYNEGYNDINVAYTAKTYVLSVVMNVSGSAYTLNYIANGKEQVGRPMYEGAFPECNFEPQWLPTIKFGEFLQPEFV